jgi:hypothetical protein
MTNVTNPYCIVNTSFRGAREPTERLAYVVSPLRRRKAITHNLKIKV